MPSNKENPYATAAGAYDSHARAHTDNQRELEARILLKANRMFQNIIESWDNGPDLEKLEEALKYNRQIWVLFYDTAIENKDGNRPNDLRSNIVNLANFIFKREMEILADPQKQKLDVLININREISAGLMTNQTTEQKPQSPSTKAETHTDISG
ncbi:MAG: flagellar biosynthesis regulator FlaF [Alphaproteobacteria bacterium]|nr:flagellar biosynthesis regulator FlaF [Alphaproteobacteria bacterium]